MRAALRTRQIANVLNTSTLLGLLLAGAGRTKVSAGPDGLLLAHGYRLGIPRAPAFTVGNVVLLRLDDVAVRARPRLLVHEGRHATQYAFCIGVPMIPCYLVAAAWSWLRCRDFARHNVFERLAGLEDGGYADPRVREVA